MGLFELKAIAVEQCFVGLCCWRMLLAYAVGLCCWPMLLAYCSRIPLLIRGARWRVCALKLKESKLRESKNRKTCCLEVRTSV